MADYNPSNYMLLIFVKRMNSVRQSAVLADSTVVMTVACH